MISMVRLIISFLAACVLSSAQAVELPPGPFAPGWTKKSTELGFTANDLYGHINGGAELFLEFGFNKLQVQDYQKNGRVLTLEVYEMDSPEGALGIYLMKKGRENRDSTIVARNSMNGFQALLVHANYFIQVNNFSGNPELTDDLRILCRQVIRLCGSSVPVTVLDHLPEKERLPGSTFIFRGPYALKPVFTFGDGDIFLLGGKIFGCGADYQTAGAGKYTRMVIPYPGHQSAQKAFENLRSNLDSYLTVRKSSAGQLVFKDYRGLFGSVIITGEIMEIKIGLTGLP